jgi:hypothetical protein
LWPSAIAPAKSPRRQDRAQSRRRSGEVALAEGVHRFVEFLLVRRHRH